MTRLETNRDLYLAVSELVNAKAGSQPSLEAYLLSVRQLGVQFQAYESLRIDDFFSLLQEAFSIRPPEFDAAWVNQYDSRTKDSGFPGWLAMITRQIIDLHEMTESGDLQNELRYFGTQSRRGSHWSNFDPCTYLECAMAGSIGGWEPGDESGRSLVPGPVAVMDETGHLVTMNPEDVPRPVCPLPDISWELFRDILDAGQHYE